MKEKFPISDDELNHLKATINHQSNQSDWIWKKAFAHYNSLNHTKPLSMQCFPCYKKVYQFISYTKPKE
jgi:hypothetical protein